MYEKLMLVTIKDCPFLNRDKKIDWQKKMNFYTRELI